VGWLSVVSCSDWLCDVVCGEFLFWFMGYCFMMMLFHKFGGQFFNKTSLVEQLEFFFDWGMWLVFLIACGLGVFA
jgi:hypothetical protein